MRRKINKTSGFDARVDEEARQERWYENKDERLWTERGLESPREVPSQALNAVSKVRRFGIQFSNWSGMSECMITFQPHDQPKSYPNFKTTSRDIRIRSGRRKPPVEERLERMGSSDGTCRHPTPDSNQPSRRLRLHSEPCELHISISSRHIFPSRPPFHNVLLSQPARGPASSPVPS